MKQDSHPNSPPKRKFYFWPYDQYPYLLGGPGIKLPSGLVETENFGRGFHFRPTYVFGVEKGRKLQAELQKLEAERTKAMADVKELYDNRLADLLRGTYADGAIHPVRKTAAC